MFEYKEMYDVIVVGGGHAGCEAALAAAKTGADCSHETKRHLLLERKTMTNLGSIFKSRDITLSTKVHLIKSIAFPVVMCECESWAIKKGDC